MRRSMNECLVTSGSSEIRARERRSAPFYLAVWGPSKTIKLADAYAFLLSDAGYSVRVGVTHKPCGAEISYPLNRLGHQTYE